MHFPVTSGNGAALRLLQAGDAGEMAAAYLRNRAHLAPWEPERPEEFFTPAGQRRSLDIQLDSLAAALAYPAALFAESRIIGRFTLSGVVRGPFQSASLGYWMDAAHQGRGLATFAVHAMCQIAGSALGLHRIEAGTLLHNHASQAVLRKCGFEQIGMAPRYLKIAGEWQDHNLYQCLLENESGQEAAAQEAESM